MPAKSGLIARFSVAQRIAHWAFTVAFFALALTGLLLMIPTISGLAAGGASRLVHRVAAVLLLVVPIYYALFDRQGLRRLVGDSFRMDADDRRWLGQFFRYAFGKAKGMPPQGRINAGEKIHHALIVISFFTIAISGLLLWFGKPFLSAGAFGWMLITHDISMYVMVLLTIGHLYFVLVYGALGGMVSGYVSRAYALLEHKKWVAEVDAAEGRKSA